MTVEIGFPFPLAGGLHARPASRLQEEVVRFRAAVTFLNRASGASASARSVLALVATRTGHGEPWCSTSRARTRPLRRRPSGAS